MTINLRVVFLALPCDAISMDVSDKLGEEQVGVHLEKVPFHGDIEKLKQQAETSRWWGSVSDVGQAFQNSLWTNMIQFAKREKLNSGQCLPCHEGQRTPGQCCNTCMALKKAFIDNGVPLDKIVIYPQCQVHDGCLVAGHIEVNRVGGNFHFAVGDSHVEGGRHHHHWPEVYRKLGFNTTHYISQLSFGGEFPGQINPLEGFGFEEDTLGQMQYFIQVVPTIFETSGYVYDTNQYSVTYQHNNVDLTSEHIELPGLFFKYDISPMMMHRREFYTPFTTFLTRVLAMMGGIWVVIGLVYSVTATTVKSVVKKLE